MDQAVLLCFCMRKKKKLKQNWTHFLVTVSKKCQNVDRKSKEKDIK